MKVQESCNVTSTSLNKSVDSENFAEDTTAEQPPTFTLFAERYSEISKSFQNSRNRDSESKRMFIKTFESLRGDVGIQSLRETQGRRQAKVTEMSPVRHYQNKTL